jgi:hypothetical protein
MHTFYSFLFCLTIQLVNSTYIMTFKNFIFNNINIQTKNKFGIQLFFILIFL